MKRLIVLGCEVFARQIFRAAAESRHVVIQVQLFERGLHDRPAALRSKLQAAIDSSVPYDAICLCFGLCGGATAGLKAPVHTPLVIPRFHDCIGVLLASRSTHKRMCTECPASLYSHRDAVERRGCTGLWTEATIPPIEELTARFGAENAAYLLSVAKETERKIQRVLHITDTTEDVAAEADAANWARQQAAVHSWRYECVPAASWQSCIVRRLLCVNSDAKWDDHDFLLVPPGCRTTTAMPSFSSADADAERVLSIDS